MYATFGDILDQCSLAKIVTVEGGRVFSSNLESAVNTFNTKEVREEAREYGREHPDIMECIAVAWIDAMADMYSKKRYDLRNKRASEICAKLKESERIGGISTMFAENESYLYKNSLTCFKKYTLVQMHRTNIQTATQMIFEGLVAAYDKQGKLGILEAAGKGIISEMLRMPMV